MEKQNVQTLKTGPMGLQLIKHFEDLETEAYTNFPNEPWTIGYGSTRYTEGTVITRAGKPYTARKDEKVQEGDRITEDQATRLFAASLPGYERMVRDMVSVPLLQNQFDALVSFAYNAGTHYKDKKGKMHPYQLWANVNGGMSADALAAYWKQTAITSGGVKANGLIRRRRVESNLYQYNRIEFFPKS